ncbi:MAG: DNA-binding protein HU [Parcubacteria group bacterium CG2_30_36_21]|nr:MAG: DNA-binding protein HU [Parcubacteria group bacterium CG2_30_36_21]
MTKEDLIEVLAKKVCCSKKEAVDCLNTVLDEIKGSLAKGKDVILTGFGTFKVSKRKARIGRNPQTGATLKIPAKTVPRFKAGKGLKDAVK